MSRLPRFLAALWLCAPLICAPAIGTFAPVPARAAPPERCDAPSELTHLSGRLARTGLRIARHEPLTVVALGSSSTEGVGASAPDATYPSRLAAELRERLPDETITVLNKGIGGETSIDELARFDRDVFAAEPDLVIWQVGTNSVLRDENIAEHREVVRRGIARLKEAGIDVVLMDAQYAPQFLAHSEYHEMERSLSLIGKEESVPVFRRFALMRHWVKTKQLDFTTMLSPDGLHLNDLGYDCIGRILAASVVEAARASTLTSHR
jgi:lysophospholipase L1-like esterase